MRRIVARARRGKVTCVTKPRWLGMGEVRKSIMQMTEFGFFQSLKEAEKGTQKTQSGPKKMNKKSETESGIVYPEAIDVADKLRALEMHGPNAETIRFLDSMRDAAMGVPHGNIEQKNSESLSGTQS